MWYQGRALDDLCVGDAKECAVGTRSIWSFQSNQHHSWRNKQKEGKRRTEQENNISYRVSKRPVEEQNRHAVAGDATRDSCDWYFTHKKKKKKKKKKKRLTRKTH